jgi:hypothetical protein
MFPSAILPLFWAKVFIAENVRTMIIANNFFIIKCLLFLSVKSGIACETVACWLLGKRLTAFRYGDADEISLSFFRPARYKIFAGSTRAVIPFL